MDLYKLIENDIQKFMGLYDDLNALAGTSDRGHEQLYALFRSELRVYGENLDATLLARLEQIESVKPVVLQEREHVKLIGQYLDELGQFAPVDAPWVPKMKVLGEVIAAHVKNVQGEVFRQARNLLDHKETEELAQLYVEIRDNDVGISA